MPGKRVAARDLPCPGLLKPLGRTLMSLQLRHNLCPGDVGGIRRENRTIHKTGLWADYSGEYITLA
jgi:hypothetical protein